MFTNVYQRDVAQAAKIHAVHKIIHNPLYNDTATDTSEIKKHLPDVDFSVTMNGALSCFFEAIGPATVKIDEDVAGTWTTLETISILSSVTTFTEYRRLITASDTDNDIRLLFTGSTTYDFRNYILYPYTFTTEDDVQQHRPFFEYTLPAACKEIAYIQCLSGTPYYTIPNYGRLGKQDYHLRSDRILAINRYAYPAEYQVHYWAEPADITFAGTSADDTKTFEVSEAAQAIMPLAIAGMILYTENDKSKGVMYLNDYENKKARLSQPLLELNEPTNGVLGW
jgi:hypothetical protein